MSTMLWGGLPAGEGLAARASVLFRDRESRRVACAAVAQAALLGAVALSFSMIRVDAPKPVQMPQGMDVSLVDGDATGPKPSARMASPEVKAPVQRPKDVDAVDQSVKQSQDGASDARPQDGPSSAGGLIWTPEVPVPNAPLVGTTQEDEGRRVVLPAVEMKKGAADPQLVSYDQGRFSDAASVREAGRLTGNGDIVMTVSVDASGGVTNCSTTVSSGSAVLDGKACELVRSYKYRPGQDAEGRPRAAIVSEVLEWARDGKFAPSGVAAPTVQPGASVAAPRAMPKVGLPSAPAKSPTPVVGSAASSTAVRPRNP